MERAREGGKEGRRKGGASTYWSEAVQGKCVSGWLLLPKQIHPLSLRNGCVLSKGC